MGRSARRGRVWAGLLLGVAGCSEVPRGTGVLSDASGVTPGPGDARTPGLDGGGGGEAGAEDAARPPDGGVAVGGALRARGVDRLHLYLVLGGSEAAGYNATDEYGWAALLLENRGHAAYDGHDLLTRFPGIEARSFAHGGWTSTEIADDLAARLDTLPRGADGDDTLVMLSAGGNDLNDDPRTILAREGTEAAVAELTAAYERIFSMLEERYQESARGRELVVVGSNVYDPTDGTGRIPDEFTERYCATIHRGTEPPYSELITVEGALANVAFFNDAIRDLVLAQGGVFADHRAWFLGPPTHGMNGGDERWLDRDCTHPTDLGHHEMRRRYWEQLTGEWL